MTTAHLGGIDPVAELLLQEGRQRDGRPLRGSERATRHAFALAFLGTALLVALVVPSGRSASAAVFVALVAGYALASRVQFEAGSGSTVPTELMLVPMLFLLPGGFVPLLVALGLVLGQLPEYVRGTKPLERVSVEIGDAWYAVGPALVFVAFGQPSPDRRGWAVLVLALLVQFATDSLVSTSREWLALRVSPRVLVRPLLWVFMVDALLAPIGLATAAASTTMKASLLLPLPLLGLLWVFASERKQRLNRELELSDAYRGTAFLLGDVVEADDEYTGAHSRDVVGMVLAVCDDLGVDARSRRQAEFAALLHDIGKIKIPAAILNKPGPLTADERRVVNTHTIEGERLLERVGGLLGQVGAVVRSCHEHYDGGGYPDGLAGDAIPMIARIIGVCDAYSAMTTDRPYRRRLSDDAARAELVEHRGTQFDPDVVDSLLKVLGDTDFPARPSAGG